MLWFTDRLRPPLVAGVPTITNNHPLADGHRAVDRVSHAALAALACPVHSSPQLDGNTWIRLPRPGARCPVSGLSRSSLSELCRPVFRNNFCPPVDARLLRRRGAQRGVLLISRSSLCAYIAGQPAPTRADSSADIAGHTDGDLANEAPVASTPPPTNQNRRAWK